MVRVPERSGKPPEGTKGGRGPDPGLCGACDFRRIVTSGRGSSFSLCLRSKLDPTFPRYPELPVLECRGFQPKKPG